MYTYQIIIGNEINSFINEIARLRIDVFREFPYLYDGDIASEEVYLSKFSEVKEASVVLVIEASKVIGAFTGLPMAFEDASIQAYIPKENLSTAYYFSEIVLNKDYRNQGIGLKMFDMLEEYVLSLQKYTVFYLATVNRTEDHPSKPINYKSLDSYWRNKGYQKTGVNCFLIWKEVNEEVASEKSLTIWEKKIVF